MGKAHEAWSTKEAPMNAIFTRRAAYHGRTEPYADPWGAIAKKWADPRPDGGKP